MRRIAVGLLCAAAVSGCAERSVDGPDPALNPAEVVAAQLVAFKENGPDDAGIARAYRFASPRNRRERGPLPRFARMIKHSFPDMLTYERVEFALLRVKSGQAAQLVTLVQPDGSRRPYVFRLSRVTTDACEGCWMVDGVEPVSPEADVPDRRGGVI